MKEFYVETKGFGQIRCEWILAENRKHAELIATTRHGISVETTSEREAR